MHKTCGMGNGDAVIGATVIYVRITKIHLSKVRHVHNSLSLGNGDY